MGIRGDYCGIARKPGLDSGCRSHVTRLCRNRALTASVDRHTPIGVTALVVVLEEARHRRLAFKVAIVLYLLAVLDMGINVCISGVVGWRVSGVVD